MEVYTHTYNRSQSDMTTFASVSKPLTTHGSTCNSGHFAILLDWFNLAKLCARMAESGMKSVYHYKDQRNLASDDMATRLKSKGYATPYTPNEISASLTDGVKFYMEGKTEDCGFSVWCFKVNYTYESNTLTLEIDETMFETEDEL